MPTTNSGIERRQHTRTRVLVETRLEILGGPACDGYTRDISSHGVCIDLYGERPPGIGARCRIGFNIWTGEGHIERQLTGKVVRSSPTAAAIAFDGDDQQTRAIVDEILHYQQFERRTNPRKKPGTTT